MKRSVALPTKGPKVTNYRCRNGTRVGLDLQTDEHRRAAGRLPRDKGPSNENPASCHGSAQSDPLTNPWSDRDKLALDVRQIFRPNSLAAPAARPGGFPYHGYGTAWGTKAAGCEMMDSSC